MSAPVFVDAPPHRWHLQRTGRGTPCLLLHGTGASLHSWAGLVPLLAERHEVLTVDLPGHGRTVTPRSATLSLACMARDVAALIDALDVEPALLVGHSAGAALVAELALSGHVDGARLVGIAPALRLPDGPARRLFPPLARIASGIDWLPRLFAHQARDPRRVRRLIEGTGSRIDATSLAGYGRLLSDPERVANVLRMMAEWNLQKLETRLPRLLAPFQLIVGTNDRTVPLHDIRRTAALLPNATLDVVHGLGHLAHEEDPARVAALIERSGVPGAERLRHRRALAAP